MGVYYRNAYLGVHTRGYTFLDKNHNPLRGSKIRIYEEGTQLSYCKMSEPSITSKKAEKEPASDIFVIKGTIGADDGFERVIELMQSKGTVFYNSDKEDEHKGPGGMISSNDIVLLKVNSQWDERGGTNTDLVKSIIEAITRHPDGFNGEIIVADNGQDQYGAAGNGGSLDWEKNNAVNISQSIQDVVDEFSGENHVSTYLWDKISNNVVEEFAEGDDEEGYVVNRNVIPETGMIVTYPKFTTKYGTRLSFKYGLYLPEKNDYNLDRLKVVNVPVLKAHRIFGVTGAVKNYMGVPSDKITRSLGYRAHNSVDKGGMGTLMAQTRIPALNILDATYVNARPGKGPRTCYENATKQEVIAASRDPIALDYWGSKTILCKLCKKITGKVHNSLDPDNSEEGSFGSWLRLSMKELNASGYDFTCDPDKMNIYLE
jgi:uncharacterized protein (DUF362 family)